MLDVAAFVKQTKAETRPYQVRVVEKAFECIHDKQMRSVLIESPTGSGKTIMALVLAKILHEAMQLRIGWCAMRRHLLAQVESENTNKGFNLPISYISMFDKDPPLNIDMLVVDEAQHDVTSSMSHIHALIKPKVILGLSATPFRVDRVKLCFDTAIKDAGIPTLIRDGYLSPYQHFTIPKWGVEEAVNLYLSDRARWGKSIMYFHRLAQCDEARKLLLLGGVSCDVISGSSNIDQQLVEFNTGKTQVILNCMKLTEGFDCPDLKTVFLRPSCKSVTIQMAGRVLRKHPSFEYKQIVQAAKTPYVFTKTALPALQHILTNGEWRTLTVNPHIDRITQRTVHALAKIEVEIPAFIKKALLKKGNTRWSRQNWRDRREGGAGVMNINDPDQTNEPARESSMDRAVEIAAIMNNRL